MLSTAQGVSAPFPRQPRLPALPSVPPHGARTPHGVFFFSKHQPTKHLDRLGHITQRLPKPRHHKGLSGFLSFPLEAPTLRPRGEHLSSTPRTRGIHRCPLCMQ